MDSLTALRAFVRVVETGSFSEAARKLGLSKSMVSRLVGGLEGELGVRLLQRTTRTLTLTEAGQTYVERCRRILADLDEANLAVSQLQERPRGRLRISAPLSFGNRHLIPCLPTFAQRYPELDLDVSMTDRFVDLVQEGFDVAARIGRLADSTLVVRRLCPIRLIICASPDYLALHGTPETPDQLGGHQCLVNEGASETAWRFVGPEGRTVTIPVQGRLRINNGDAQRAMALAGLGLVYLPTFFVGDDIRAGRLVPVLTRFIPQDAALHAVFPHSRHLSPKVRAFVDHLAATFAPTPYWDEGLFDID